MASQPILQMPANVHTRNENLSNMKKSNKKKEKKTQKIRRHKKKTMKVQRNPINTDKHLLYIYTRLKY